MSDTRLIGQLNSAKILLPGGLFPCLIRVFPDLIRRPDFDRRVSYRLTRVGFDNLDRKLERHPGLSINNVRPDESLIGMRSIAGRRDVPLLASLNYGAGLTADIFRPDFVINEAGSRTGIITAQDQSSAPQTGDSPAYRLAKAAKDYLIRAGIDGSRIIIDTGSPRYQTTVEIYLGPKGATLPSTSTNATSSSVREEDIDVLWDVLPQSIAGDNFGRRVRKEFYIIQVAIVNNSGVEFQLLGFGFTLGGTISGVPPGSSIPPTGYRLVRGAILREQQNGIRSRSLALLTLPRP